MSDKLIAIRNKNGVWENKTDQIEKLNYLGHNTEVKFLSAQRVYTYRSSNVKKRSFSKSVDINLKIVKFNGELIGDCVELKLYEDIYIVKRRYQGEFVADKSDIIVLDSCLVNKSVKSIYDYLLDMSKHINVTNDGKMLLFEQMKKIKSPSKESSLATYLSRNEIKQNRIYEDGLIYPFGVNSSQKKATEMALSNQISIIEGPPGTGKTQTILNLIANIVSSGSNVAVVSSNNSAMANVQEKLEKYGYGFLTARLGNRDNQRAFFEYGQKDTPDLVSWKKTSEWIHENDTKLEMHGKELRNLLELNNEVSRLKEKLREIELERVHFESVKGYNHASLGEWSNRKVWLPEHLLDFIRDIEYMHGKNATWLERILFKWKYRVRDVESIIDEADEVINAATYHYYSSVRSKLQTLMSSLDRKLEKRAFTDLFDEYQMLSEKLFRARLAGVYDVNRRITHTSKGFKKDFDSFIKDYPVILSTTHSILNCIPEGYMFDYLIIDEASQVDLVTAAIAMSCCINIIIVGDVKQLPQIVPRQIKEVSNNLQSKYHIGGAYDYANENIISSLEKIYMSSLPKTLLMEHYRCHPMIIGFCNRKFYNDQLVVMSMDKSTVDLPMEIIRTAPGNHARFIGNSSTPVNYRQMEVIKSEILDQYNDYSNVGVISPYREHANMIKSQIGDETIEVDTVHKFQGREKSHIVFTTASNTLNTFVDDENLVNVAVSRAVDKFTVIVSDKFGDKHGSNIGDLIRYIDYQTLGDGVKTSHLVSVFDLLYSDQTKRLIEWQSGKKRISKYASENLAYDIIQELLDEKRFNVFKCVYHIPLASLFKETSMLDEEEMRFAKHPWSHVDFLIFNRHDKQPVLVIEVDGFAFHANNPEQMRRDRLKDQIFEKKDLPLIRIETHRSGERERIMKALEKVVGSTDVS